MYDIVTVGEILVEILSEKVDQTFDRAGILLGPYPSGAPAIAIDQAARMGARTAIIAKVGRDDFALVNTNRLSSDGVDVSHIVEVTDNSTGCAFVTYFSDGSRKFIFHFSKAACGELGPDDVDEEVIKNARWLHITGCSITASASLGAAIMKAVAIAKENKTRISFDPNIRPELLDGDLMHYYHDIIKACDVLLTGKSELALLYGDVEPGVRELLRGKDRIIVCKDGSKGTSVYTRTDAFTISTYPATEVDPTGAGDSFDGTFIAMLCEGADLRTAADYGNAAGARAVEQRGPMEGNSWREDLDRFRLQAGARVITELELLHG